MTRASWVNFYPVMSEDTDMTQAQACRKLYEFMPAGTGVDGEPDVLDGEITLGRGQNYPYEDIRSAVRASNVAEKLEKYYVLVCIPSYPKCLVYIQKDATSPYEFDSAHREAYMDASPQTVAKETMADEGYSVHASPTVPPDMGATPEL